MQLTSRHRSQAWLAVKSDGQLKLLGVLKWRYWWEFRRACKRNE
jgi:hypothetical protein